jgi:hypothetical protein
MLSLTSRYEDLDPCLDDYTDWYVANQTRITDFPSCLRFLRLAIDGRLYLLNLLWEELVALRTAETSDLDKALHQFTQDYVFNTQTIVDPVKMVQFLKQATDDTLHLLHLMRDELRICQEKKRESFLWLPQ